MKSGMHRETGASISGQEYLKQRLSDLFRFGVGEAPGFRAYGANLRFLLDRKISQTEMMRLYESMTEAVENPKNGLEDFKLQNIQLKGSASSLEIILTGHLKENLESVEVTLEHEPPGPITL